MLEQQHQTGHTKSHHERPSYKLLNGTIAHDDRMESFSFFAISNLVLVQFQRGGKNLDGK